MVQEDSGLQKSMQIKNRLRKQGPKKVCGIERKRSQHGAQIGARGRQHFRKIPEKRHPKNDANKKLPNGTAQTRVELEPGMPVSLVLGRRGVGG